MIARLWHGRVPAAKEESYLTYLHETGLADYLATPGNHGAYVLLHREDGVTHFEVFTFWETLEAIHSFAGDEVSVARYYPQDDDFLLEREPHVRHFEVAFASAGRSPA